VGCPRGVFDRLFLSRAQPYDELLCTTLSPHVYFVTGKENPTPTIYEVFDERVDRTDSVLRQIDTLGVTTVVINRRRNVSGPMDPRLEAALTRYSRRYATGTASRSNWRLRHGDTSCDRDDSWH
jgi:hypothetical protein